MSFILCLDHSFGGFSSAISINEIHVDVMESSCSVGNHISYLKLDCERGIFLLFTDVRLSLSNIQEVF